MLQALLMIGIPIFIFNSGNRGAYLISLFLFLPGMILLGAFIGILNNNPFDDDFSVFSDVGPWAVGVPLAFFALKPKG